MADMITCEHCGTVARKDQAEVVVVENWSHYFCCETCKLQWAEQAEIEDDDAG